MTVISNYLAHYSKTLACLLSIFEKSALGQQHLFTDRKIPGDSLLTKGFC